MKFGHLEGTPEEIRDFFENNGLDANNYFQPVERPIHTAWLVAPAVVVLLMVIVLWLNFTANPRHQWLAFLLGCLSTVWLGAILQIKYKQPMVTGFAAVGCVVVLVIAFGLLTPLEAIEQLKQFHK